MTSDDTLSFFADIILDFSSYFTKDLFRATALNTFHRCEEVLRFVQEVKSSGLREGAVSSLLEELFWFGERDVVIKSKFANDWNELSFLFDEGTLSKKFFAVERLHKRIQSSYLRECRNLIEQEIRKGEATPHKGGDKLLQLGEIFYSHLINSGHSEEEIFRQSTSIIKRRSADSDPTRTLQDFFAAFPCRLREFDAYVSAASELSAALPADIAESITGKVPSEIYERHKDTLNPGDASKSVFLIKDIKAFDFGDARAQAESKLVLARSIAYTMNVHSETNWVDRMVIVQAGTADGHAIVGPLSPMRWRRRISDKYANRIVGERVSVLLGNHLKSEVADKIIKSITEYSNGFHADGLSTQLVSVWSALEGLLPRVNDQESRIAEISEIVVVCQQAAYFRNMLQWVYSLHRERNPDEFQKIVGSIAEPKSELSRFALALFDPKYRSVSDKLKNLVSDRPLAQLRIYRLLAKLKDSKSKLSALKWHGQKVSWQGKRIYLERNRIVHNASPSRNIESILTNLCEYYLSCLDVLLDELKLSPHYDIGYAFQEAKLRQDLRMRALSKGNNDLKVALGFDLSF
ncbi:hypothetical protein FHW19_004253 [Ochrobactrum anthropi]|uniref:hypothetical protein n=1 Tax=Brucella anthropi TaxID=529 RepID=UPI0015FCB9FE|nr:hypothetical protein [Brucella anthropi]MBA8862507.1 hypothetical protein [Brucella anthropi]